MSQKGVIGVPPLKETFLEVDPEQAADLGSTPLPPLADGSAAASVPASEERASERAIQTAWSDLLDAESVLDLLLSATTSDGAREMDGRKRREVRAGLDALLERFTVRKVVLGLGYWVGNRRMANADILAEIVTTRLERVDYDLTTLPEDPPLAILREGLRLGEDERRDRLARDAG